MRIGLSLIALGLAGIVIKHFELSDPILRAVGVFPATEQDEILEAHRKSQTKPDRLPAVALTEGNSSDWPEYRGRNRDGIVIGPPISRDWKAKPPKQLWKQPVGGGFAAFSVAGNVAVTIEQRRDREAVVCYDTETGHERWLHDYQCLFRESSGSGPRATPTIAGADVFSMGATGRLVCLDTATGKHKWSVETLDKNKNLIWGMAGSPLVLEQLVVVGPGAQVEGGATLVAYERTTGREAWRSGHAQTGYSSPMLATLAGKSQIVFFDAGSVAGYDPLNGRLLWQFPWPTGQGINVAQPLMLEGDCIFLSSSYGFGCGLIRIKNEGGEWKAEEIWKNTAMHCKFTSPVFFQGHFYGLDEGILVCVDEKTGKRKWKDGRYGHGQLLLTGDLLLILSDTGQLVLVEATPAAHHELAKIPALEGKTWNCPVLVDGRVYVRNETEMACYDLRQ